MFEWQGTYRRCNHRERVALRRQAWVYPWPQGEEEEMYRKRNLIEALWKKHFRVTRDTFDYICQLHANKDNHGCSTAILLCDPFWYSLRADEIKLWLTPSAKQLRNPCSGLPAVYPDLSTRHDWPVKKGLCFVCCDHQPGWGEIRNALTVIRWVRWGSRTRISVLLRRRY